jgi:hypothetical protein
MKMIGAALVTLSILIGLVDPSSAFEPTIAGEQQRPILP